MKLLLASAILWAATCAFAQTSDSKAKPSETEQNDLREALAEAGSSPVEFSRALEKHLEKYPDSPQRADIERALAKAAIEARDDQRTLLYGQKVLERGGQDPQVMDRVTRLLLRSDDPQSAAKALKYAQQFEALMRTVETEGPSGSRNRTQILDELDRAIARSLVFQARATGNLGKTDEAIVLARKAYERYPNADGAREIGRWLARTGKDSEAIEAYADAFTLSDPRNNPAEHAKDRARMSELYLKSHPSEAGLGDVVLKSYDRTSELLARREALQKDLDPNSQANDVMQFTLSSLTGDKLDLASLKEKVVVMDFWATWCGPCRVQHPLIEEVKKRFAERKEVVFLSVNTDEDTSLVRPFVASQKWEGPIYLDGGLKDFLNVSSIPTTVIIDKGGKLVNRMNGFLPERFVEMLSDRINDALGVRAPAQKAQK
jgi:thiol-disulfide isomerase/thioredoxin